MADILDFGPLPLLASVRSDRTYAKGAEIFASGRPALGIFLVLEGKVRLTADCGEKLLVGLAGPGAVLGLSETVAGDSYQTCAESLQRTRIGYVTRGDLLALMQRRSEFCFQVLELLCHDLHDAYHKLRSARIPRSRCR